MIDDYTDLVAGARVEHWKYGWGTVLTGEVDADQVIVRFDCDPEDRPVWASRKNLSTEDPS